MELKKITYPSNSDNWYTFGKYSGASKIENQEIEKWINDGINSVKKQLENKVESPYSFTASGNTIVIVFFSQDNPNEIFADENYFNIIIAQNYIEGSFFISELKKEENNKSIKTLENQFENFIENITNISEEVTTFQLGDYEIDIRKKNNNECF